MHWFNCHPGPEPGSPRSWSGIIEGATMGSIKLKRANTLIIGNNNRLIRTILTFLWLSPRAWPGSPSNHLASMVRLISYSVYIMSNVYHTVFYVGVTSDLPGRTWQHKNGEGGPFTAKYNCSQLLYYEDFLHIQTAIAREKQIKKWRKAGKLKWSKKKTKRWKTSRPRGIVEWG